MTDINRKSTKTAKLDRELFFKIGKGNLPITGNAINFMLYTIPYVAKDGRIYCSKQQIRNNLYLQHKTLNRVISELKLLGLISEKDGFLYSHFHVLSNGEKDSKGYMQNIKAFTSNDIMFANIKKKRLFLYVASFARIGVPKAVSVEALYSNKYHSGVNYIESYQELSEILFEFVQKGYFVVHINGQRYDNKSANFEQVFHSYCGYDQVSGKQRMSKIKKHKIAIQINNKIATKAETVPNQSSKEEFKYFAEQNNIYHELMRSKTIPFFINIQNELYDLFGTIGVELYRHALISYFSSEEENVLYHDLMSNKNETKAVNTLVDFYLMKDVQDIIVNVLAKENTDDAIIQYFSDRKHLSDLILYFVQKSSDNHKILLDEALDNHNIHLDELVQRLSSQHMTDYHLQLLNNHISDIYQHIHLKSIENQKELIRQWAKEGILAKKEWIKQATEQLKMKVAPFISRETIDISNVHSFIKSKAEWKESKDSYAEQRRNIRKQNIERARKKSIDDITINF